MTAINDRYIRISGVDPPFCAFVEDVYLKSGYVAALSESTRDEYQGMWDRYLKQRLEGETLGSIRPVTVNTILESIVRSHDIGKYTIQHVKALLSGIFAFARNHGHFDGANPVTGVRLPKARAKSETYAYELKEETEIMGVLNLRKRAAIATASYGGLSKSELQGLRWEDRFTGCLHIRRNVWSGIEKETKNIYRAAPVPIISQLGAVLDDYWNASGRPAAGWVWPASRGSILPMDFNNLYRRHIMARMREANLIWYGWHAFRSGLASNLSELGAPDNVIQQIPRHGDLGTTQKFYRKTRRPAVAKAMKKLSN